MKNTAFGWIVSGTLIEPISKVLCCNFSKNSSLDGNLKLFWEIEETTHLPSLPDDKECEQHFQETVSRNPDGRFIVRISLRYDASQLGDSRQIALKRLLQLEHRFVQNPTLKQLYVSFMTEYRSLGHMSLSESDGSKINYFLPHHGVLRDSLSTKLRVVFDGSAASDSGWSVNDLQFIGPPVHTEQFSILLQFRQHPFAVCADITKMYRQILVHPDDRCLWRDDAGKEVCSYTLNTVTYGTASAPYLAIRCLRQLAADVKEQFPVASTLIINNFYVDDLIVSFASVNEAIVTCQQISQILSSACFPLRKWVSNNPKIGAPFQSDH